MLSSISQNSFWFESEQTDVGLRANACESDLRLVCEQAAARAAGRNAFMTFARSNRIKRPKTQLLETCNFTFLTLTYFISDLFSCVQAIYLRAFQVLKFPSK